MMKPAHVINCKSLQWRQLVVSHALIVLGITCT
jgi:hypothetical protein